MQKTFRLLSVCLVFSIINYSHIDPYRHQATTPSANEQPWGPYDLINLINSMRTSNGLQALTVDNIVMSVSQYTAEIMAANNMQGHIGNVRGRIQDAGFGGGRTVFATENYIVLRPGDEDRITSGWSDAEHMRPVTDPNYTHIGAGVALTSDNRVYYIVQAAYTSPSMVNPAIPNAQKSGTPVGNNTQDPMAEYIYSVITVTPQSDGNLIHVVQPGQSLWSIAIAYNTKMAEIARLTGFSLDSPTIYTGQKLWIPTPSYIAMTQTQAPTISAEATHQPSITPIPTKTTPITPSLSPETGDSAEMEDQDSSDQKPIIWMILISIGVGALLILFGALIKR
jgi:LysM repeat protein